MKKLLFIAAILVAGVCNAQETDKEKLMAILESATKNPGNIQKLDSLKTETEKLKSSTDVSVRMMLPEVMSVFRTASAMNVTAKPLKTEFSSLEKDFQKNFQKDDDKFKETSFIKIKGQPKYRIIPYVSVNKNIVRLRLKTTYIGSGWLFFDKVIFNIDGKNYEYSVEKPRTEVRGGGGVAEYSDELVDDNMLSILKIIASSNSLIDYRLSGDKYSDFKLSEKDKEAISSVLLLYDKLTQ